MPAGAGNTVAAGRDAGQDAAAIDLPVAASNLVAAVVNFVLGVRNLAVAVVNLVVAVADFVFAVMNLNAGVVNLVLAAIDLVVAVANLVAGLARLVVAVVVRDAAVLDRSEGARDEETVAAAAARLPMGIGVAVGSAP